MVDNITIIDCCDKCAASKHCTGGFTYETFDHEEGGKPPTCTLHRSGEYVSASVCVGCVSFLKLLLGTLPRVWLQYTIILDGSIAK